MSHIFSMDMHSGARTGAIVLSTAEAEEYRSFKRQKRISEVWTALARSESEGARRGITVSELKKVCESALNIRAAAVRVNPNFILPAKSFLGASGVKVDCVIGGLGETLVKVKAYEAKCAVRNGANELTLILSPSALRAERSGELKREIKKVVKAAKRAVVKVAVEGEWPVGELVKLARLISESGAKFLSTANFADAVSLKKELADRCMLEITGVEKAEEYKALALAGAERIATNNGAEIYSLLMREAENCELERVVEEPLLAMPTDVERKSPFEKKDNNERRADV